MRRVVAKAMSHWHWHRRLAVVAVAVAVAVLALPSLSVAQGGPRHQADLLAAKSKNADQLIGQGIKPAPHILDVEVVEDTSVTARRSEFNVAVPNRIGPRFAVLPFENRSGVSSLDWLGPAAAFVAGELSSGHRGIRPGFGSLVIPRAPRAAPTPSVIAGYAQKQQANYIITGSFARPNWQLELTVELWRVEHPDRGRSAATRIGVVINLGEFKEVHSFLGRSLVTLWAQAGYPIAASDLDNFDFEPSHDFYAFTIFGRGLAALSVARSAREWASSGKKLRRAVFIDPSMREGHLVLGEYYRLVSHQFSPSAQKKLLPRLHRSSRTPRSGPQNAIDFSRSEFHLVLQGSPHAATSDSSKSVPEAFLPTTAPALIALAELAQERRDLEDARDLFLAALKQRPYDFDTRYQLGKLLWDTGHAEDSFAVLSSLVERRPNDVRARRILVMIHSSRGSGKALVAELEAVAALDPGDERTRMDLGAAYAAIGRNRDAIHTYNALARDRPGNASAHKFLGDLYQKGGQHQLAAKHYNLAIKADPNDPRAYFVLGALYVASGDDDKAQAIYLRAQRFHRYASQVHNNLGSIFFRAKALSAALYHLGKAVAGAPRRARYRYNHALALSSNGQLDKALSEVNQGLRFNPKHTELNYLKGVIHLRAGDIDIAVVQFERTLELDPSHKNAEYNLRLIEQLKRRSEDGELVHESSVAIE